MRNRLKLLRDDEVDRHQVEAQRCVEPRCTNALTRFLICQTWYNYRAGVLKKTLVREMLAYLYVAYLSIFSHDIFFVFVVSRVPVIRRRGHTRSHSEPGS